MVPEAVSHPSPLPSPPSSHTFSSESALSPISQTDAPAPPGVWETCSHTCLVCCSCEKSCSSFGRKKIKTHNLMPPNTRKHDHLRLSRIHPSKIIFAFFFLVPLKLHVLFLPIPAIAQKPHHVHPTLVPGRLRQKGGASLMLVTLRAPKCASKKMEVKNALAPMFQHSVWLCNTICTFETDSLGVGSVREWSWNCLLLAHPFNIKQRPREKQFQYFTTYISSCAV